MSSKKESDKKGSDIYCSVGNVPKNKRRGNMKECVENKQIRFYGIKKIDAKLLSKIIKDKKQSKTLETLKEKEAKYSAKLKNTLKDYEKENKKKVKNEKLLKELKDEYNDLVDKVNILRKQINKS